jgi:hypothetical protein
MLEVHKCRAFLHDCELFAQNVMAVDNAAPNWE